MNKKVGLNIEDSDLLLTPVVRPTNNPHIVPEITTTTQTLISAQNHQVDIYDEYEKALNIDDSDLRLTLVPIRIIPGPAGIVQITKLRKLVNTREGGEESVMSTQEYIRKVIEDVGEDDDFTRVSWLSAIDSVNVDGGIVTGCFRDVKKFLKNGKHEKVVAVIKSCTPNTLGDLTVTLKDLSSTIFGTIHYKVLIEERKDHSLAPPTALDYVGTPSPISLASAFLVSLTST
ncbi:hypothetical protein Tco_1449664 [Tanacetum coccineum]